MAKNVKCPYYRGEINEKIRCKAEMIGDEVFIHIVFKTPKDRTDYQLDYCCDAFDLCPIAQSNDEVWEEQG